MQDQHSPQPESNDSHIDPSIWRGMTQRRMSRRQMLRAAGTGAGALGVSAFLAACGVKGATVTGGSTPKPGALVVGQAEAEPQGQLRELAPLHRRAQGQAPVA